MEHAKGKWKQGKSNTLIYAGDKCVADCLIRPRHEESEANARRIVQCCNSHDELVEALEATDLSLNECTKHLLGTGEIPEPEALALTIIQVKQALNSAKSPH